MTPRAEVSVLNEAGAGREGISGSTADQPRLGSLPLAALLAHCPRKVPGVLDLLVDAVVGEGGLQREEPVTAVVVNFGPAGCEDVDLWRAVGESACAYANNGRELVLVYTLSYRLSLDATQRNGPITSRIKDMLRDCGVSSLRDAATDQRRHPGAVIGIGDVRSGLHELHDSWCEASDAARVARAVPDVGPVAAWADLGVYRLIAAASGARLAEALIQPGIRLLFAPSSAGLLLTARTFLENAGDVAQTAHDLFVHRQTVYQRLARVRRLTGFDLDDGRDRLQMHAAIALYALAHEAPSHLH